jgi:hypothetical protein
LALKELHVATTTLEPEASVSSSSASSSTSLSFQQQHALVASLHNPFIDIATPAAVVKTADGNRKARILAHLLFKNDDDDDGDDNEYDVAAMRAALETTTIGDINDDANVGADGGGDVDGVDDVEAAVRRAVATLAGGGVAANAFLVAGGNLTTAGVAVYPRMALFNHSCTPNCVVSYEEPPPPSSSSSSSSSLSSPHASTSVPRAHVRTIRAVTEVRNANWSQDVFLFSSLVDTHCLDVYI